MAAKRKKKKAPLLGRLSAARAKRNRAARKPRDTRPEYGPSQHAESAGFYPDPGEFRDIQRANVKQLQLKLNRLRLERNEAKAAGASEFQLEGMRHEIEAVQGQLKNARAERARSARSKGMAKKKRGGAKKGAARKRGGKSGSAAKSRKKKAAGKRRTPRRDSKGHFIKSGGRKSGGRKKGARKTSRRGAKRAAAKRRGGKKGGAKRTRRSSGRAIAGIGAVRKSLHAQGKRITRIAEDTKKLERVQLGTINALRRSQGKKALHQLPSKNIAKHLSYKALRAG